MATDLPRPRGDGLQAEIYETLRTAILGGTLAPGERLLELHLARHFGTSQTPVREALRHLTQERLVEYRPRRGTYVRMPRLEEVADVYSLRAELEVWAARRFMSRATAEDHERLLVNVGELDRAATHGDYTGVVNADMQVHRALCEASGSPLLLEIWTAIDNRVRGLRASSSPPSKAALKDLADQHRGIVDAVLSGDAEAAEQLIREHMRAAPPDIPHGS